MIHLFWSVVIGLLAGAIAKLAMPGRDPGGLGVTLALGVAGSLLAGFAGRALHLYSGGARPGIIASAIGAFVLLGIYRLVVRWRGRTDHTRTHVT